MLCKQSGVSSILTVSTMCCSLEKGMLSSLPDTNTEALNLNLVLQSSWSGRRPVTAEIAGSSPARTAKVSFPTSGIS